ncbi:non-homologous end-joining DNA ligase [Ensifer sp. 1H6]|uniref:non-homologous end-joining DNA ligase n=1 Tax=Ensifer sp. 1H6 TaxID=1911585 RepID=UPI0009D20441|nr:non-homologous end-joining DNA ligase [Ensifer sp. 1H6]OMQ44915.1 ATP-dependent DNA ligase [Ensifer sp. 1H6]
MAKGKRPKQLLLDDDAVLRGQPKRPRDPDQPRLSLDLMPDRIEPCLALLAKRVPTAGDWSFEIKWDGYRLAVHVEAGRVRILTRGGHDWTHRFAAIEAAAKALGPATMILDGEAVVLDDAGRSNFGMLQAALGGRGGKRVADEALFYAFDLLYFDGHDLRGMEQQERRQILENVIGDGGSVIRLSEEIEGDGAVILETVCEFGLEGIIAKDRRAPYRSGRKGDWLKLKCIQSDSFVVVGFEPSTKVTGAISRLLLAARQGDELVYVGGVGTGFTDKMARDLRKQLSAMPAKVPPVTLKRKNAIFCEPAFVAEITYTEITSDGKLRHPSFKGLRELVDNVDVFELKK